MDINERISPIIEGIRGLNGKLDPSNEGFIHNTRKYVDLCQDLCNLCLSAFEQGYKLTKGDENDDLRPGTEAAMLRAKHWYLRCKFETNRAEKAEHIAEEAKHIASELCDDFADYVTSGVPNPAPYCANQCPECVNCRGWCTWGTECQGFYPKAAKRQEADEHGKV